MQMTELPILYFHADDYGMTAHGDASSGTARPTAA